MILFIVLHTGEAKSELRVQVHHILAVCKSEADEFDEASLLLSDGEWRHVNETPEQIMAMLQSFAARSQMVLPPGAILKS